MGDWSHLDYWRIKPLDDGEFAFGPVRLWPRFNANARAFLTALAPTPRHGMLWSDAEAMGFIRAQIGKEASRAARHINEPFRTAVRARAGREGLNVGPLVRVCPSHGKGTPMCVAIHSGNGWMEAFRAAIVGGVTAHEVDRLNALTGESFTADDLACPPRFRVVERYRNDLGFTWEGFSKQHPLYRAIAALALLNNDEPFDWGDCMQISFGFGWLRKPKPDHAHCPA